MGIKSQILNCQSDVLAAGGLRGDDVLHRFAAGLFAE